jgi:hypothetical protein
MDWDASFLFEERKETRKKGERKEKRKVKGKEKGKVKEKSLLSYTYSPMIWLVLFQIASPTPLLSKESRSSQRESFQAIPDTEERTVGGCLYGQPLLLPLLKRDTIAAVPSRW